MGLEPSPLKIFQSICASYTTMIISHRHKFIFLKNNKCAGSSIEIALSKFCGPDDVLSVLSAEEEALRVSLGYAPMQNNVVPPEHYTLMDHYKVLRGQPKPRYHSHMRARELIKRIDPEIWSSYFKFCFVRNPWDRVTSLHYHRAGDGVRTSLDKSSVTTDKVLSRLNARGWGMYTINEKPVVDAFYRYENMSEEIEKLRLRLGLTEPLELPNTKGEYRKKKGTQGYQELLSETEKNRIAKHLKKEIDLFGYEF